MMQFHYPLGFYGFAAWAALVLFYWVSHWRRRRAWARLGEARLIRQLLPVDSLKRRIIKDGVALLALLLVMAAATGPQFGASLKEVKLRGIDVFIAMDTSRSMLAEDISPSRLQRAKRSLSALITKLSGNRLGIIAFARQAIVQCPLTVDAEAARLFLEILDENSVPVQGTSIGEAIRLALERFPQNSKAGRAIVLLTDGEDHQSDPLGAARLARDQGVVIFTIGIGTTKGEVIKDRNEQGELSEFHKYKGELVLSRLDDATLSQIAQITGGKYFRASSTDSEIDDIADTLSGFTKRDLSTKRFNNLKERYQIFLFIGLLLLIAEFFFAERSGQWKRMKEGFYSVWSRRRPRRASVVSAAGLLVLLWPLSAHAHLKDHVRKGVKHVEKKDFAAARQEFEAARIEAPEAAFLPYNIATSYLMEGNLEEAKKNYQQALLLAKEPLLKSRINYNLAHVLFYSNDPQASIETFKECLRLNPSDQDAKYNIEYIRAGKTPPQKPQPAPSPSQQKGPSEKGNKNDALEKKEGEQGSDQKPSDEKSDASQQKRERVSLSGEDAERILQMLQDQESEKMRNAPVFRPGSNKRDPKNKAGAEDW